MPPVMYELSIPIACPSKGSLRSFGGSRMTVDMHASEIKVVEEMVRLRFRSKYPGVTPKKDTKFGVFAILVWPHRDSDYSRSKKSTGVPVASYASYKGTTPDADKCMRTVLDAMAGLVYENDSRVVFQASVKVYGQKPRILIFCREVIRDGNREQIAGFVHGIATWFSDFERREAAIIAGELAVDRHIES